MSGSVYTPGAGAYGQAATRAIRWCKESDHA
jgi:hypothetical protein